MKLKKLFMTLLLALGIGASAIGVGTAVATNTTKKLEVAEADTTKMVYFDPGLWDSDGAVFGIHAWNSSGSVDKLLTDGNKDGFYEVAIDSSYDNILFVRFSNGTTSFNWGKAWNQTGDLEIPGTGDVLGFMATFDHVVCPPMLVGKINGSENWSNKSHKFEFDFSKTRYTYTVDLKVNDEFKVNNGTWNWELGYNKFNKNDYISNNGGNVRINKAGRYRITLPYDVVNNGISGCIIETENEAVVNNFVTDYMHTENEYNPDPELAVNQNMDCKNKSWYSNAKTAFIALTSEQKTLLKTNHIDAYNRLKAWAAANGEIIDDSTFNITSRSSGVMGILRIENNSNPTVLFVTVLASLSFVVLVIVFLKKKKINK